MQILFPALILLLAWFLPESSRWLYTRGKHSEAKKVLAKYHGLGREDSVWVTMQINEYEEYLNMDGAALLATARWLSSVSGQVTAQSTTSLTACLNLLGSRNSSRR